MTLVFILTCYESYLGDCLILRPQNYVKFGCICEIFVGLVAFSPRGAKLCDNKLIQSVIANIISSKIAMKFMIIYVTINFFTQICDIFLEFAKGMHEA